MRIVSKGKVIELSPDKKKSRDGFTMVELLIVMTIIVVLASLLGPMLNSALRGNNLTQGADKVLDVLSLARQTALTKNQTVEVRFYAYTDSETPGDTGQGHAIQPFLIDDSGNASPIIKATLLPNTVVITTNSTLSSLFIPTNATAANLSFKIPRAGSNYTCYSFRYHRSGMTDLAGKTTAAGDQNWCVTLVNVIDAISNNNLPKNYTTITIDPYNGAIRAYRPTL